MCFPDTKKIRQRKYKLIALTVTKTYVVQSNFVDHFVQASYIIYETAVFNLYLASILSQKPNEVISSLKKAVHELVLSSQYVVNTKKMQRNLGNRRHNIRNLLFNILVYV